MSAMVNCLYEGGQSFPASPVALALSILVIAAPLGRKRTEGHEFVKSEFIADTSAIVPGKPIHGRPSPADGAGLAHLLEIFR